MSEVAHLKVDDVDSARMLLRVEQGHAVTGPLDRLMALMEGKTPPD